jgi:uncharacterized protein (DUF983 family)
MVLRGLRKRCPRCGTKGIFTSWSKLVPACPSCGLVFEREEGYWVGAIIVNTAVTETTFFLLFIGTILITMPDVAWGPLLGVALGTNAIVPIWFYPRSKTLWVAIDNYFHRPG